MSGTPARLASRNWVSTGITRVHKRSPYWSLGARNGVHGRAGAPVEERRDNRVEQTTAARTADHLQCVQHPLERPEGQKLSLHRDQEALAGRASALTINTPGIGGQSMST